MAQPTQIGRYQVLAELGTGAMGSVYLARDSVLGREVALKTCRLSEFARPEDLRGLRARLLNEARSAAAIAHPHVVAVYDVVESDDGSVFIAMEYVPGSNLEARLRAGPLSTPEALRIFEQLADALDFVHQRGFVHRDIKPANVLLDRDDQVKLADFGIAQLCNQDEAGDSSMFGTPQYMAPEQILGLRTDARTDVFACGVLLFEVLSGRKPFAGRTVAEVARRILIGDLTAPEGLVFGMAPVLRRALAREPDDRYPSAGALVQAMRQALREDPDSTIVTMARSPIESPVAAPRQRHWLAAGLAAAVVAALVVGTALYQRMTAAGEARAQEVGYARLITEGLAKIEADDPQAAIVLFNAAQKLDPNPVQARTLAALAQRRIPRPARYAGEVAGTAAVAGVRADGGAARLDPSAPGAAGAARPQPSAHRRAVRPVAAGTAVLIVNVVSQSRAGMLVLFRDNRQILRLPFDFHQPAKWFSRQPAGGHRREELRVASGRAVLRVLLARRDEPGVMHELPLDLAPGDRRTLELRVPSTGRPEIRWQSQASVRSAESADSVLRREPRPGTPRSSAAGL